VRVECASCQALVPEAITCLRGEDGMRKRKDRLMLQQEEEFVFS
jgi:hypothetical protein